MDDGRADRPPVFTLSCMPLTRVEFDRLTYLASQFRRLAQRTDHARRTAIGASDFGPGVAHDAALNEQIDWFYRRWVQRLETASSFMLTAADEVERAKWVYKLTDDEVRKSAETLPSRRVGADL